MTSGPAPINALPPESDPQVVAWMRAYLRECPDTRYGDLVHAYRRTHGVYQPPVWDALYAAEDAACRPLTVPDIPAGQGGTSLYRDTDGAVWFKEANGYQRIVLLSPDEMSRQTPSGQALEAFLAATLPTVTEDAP